LCIQFSLGKIVSLLQNLLTCNCPIKKPYTPFGVPHVRKKGAVLFGTFYTNTKKKNPLLRVIAPKVVYIS
jgi:hypothetical protein